MPESSAPSSVSVETTKDDSAANELPSTDIEKTQPATHSNGLTNQTFYLPRRKIITLIIFRAVTGVGGGGLILLGQLIVGDVVSVRERGKYQGILGAFVALSNGIGPLIGAAYSQKASWRWIFRMNMPLAVFASVCVYFFMPLKKVHGTAKDKLKKVDFIGSFLVLVETGSIILGLTWGGAEYPLGTKTVSPGRFRVRPWVFARVG
ncbi:unnamed protein product [Rhizoctonia solani]|uniref:Major facilitator superfamily (MFS) profile domain-containing protein n=1 Tax=Rhizoctonia solani TaxID=456999 RepID=A0A8H3DDC2_9AGAM|nr:unnamed protein product [Rhizoctonia solani]